MLEYEVLIFIFHIPEMLTVCSWACELSHRSVSLADHKDFLDLCLSKVLHLLAHVTPRHTPKLIVLFRVITIATIFNSTDQKSFASLTPQDQKPENTHHR